MAVIQAKAINQLRDALQMNRINILKVRLVILWDMLGDILLNMQKYFWMQIFYL